MQHKDNPVQWYPWGPEALEEAKKSQKPIFLSIGYATCHWCHVMAHESFEDPEVAELLNKYFVCIKVDREERPDLDQLYMTVCQMMAGQGGWPLNVMLTPELEPFFAGTYFPKHTRGNRAGMLELIPRAGELWQKQQHKVLESARHVTLSLKEVMEFKDQDQSDIQEVATLAFEQFQRDFDAQWGGWGQAPKFPSPHNFLFLFRWHHLNKQAGQPALEMALHTLRKMRLGGLWDHVGGGFHRYSTDSQWLLPHFEKMLYDQALLLMAYTEAWQISKEPLFQDTVEQLVEFLRVEMRDQAGGFYSAIDADSEGEEGKFYTWGTKEWNSVLGNEDTVLGAIFHIREDGNFWDEALGMKTGQNIPWLEQVPDPEAWKSARRKLYEARQKRVRPITDDKVLSSWNGLIMAALAKAGRVFGRKDWTEMGRQTGAFIQAQLQNEDGKLWHRFRSGKAGIEGQAEDYAFLSWGHLELFLSTQEPRHLRRAVELMECLQEDFAGPQGGYYFSGSEQTDLIHRSMDLYDGASPSANSVALWVLQHLWHLTGEAKFAARSRALVQKFSGTLKSSPRVSTFFLSAWLWDISGGAELVISQGAKAPEESVLEKVQEGFFPFLVWLSMYPDGMQNAARELGQLAPFLAAYKTKSDQSAFYLCTNGVCNQPVHSWSELKKDL